MTVMSISTNSPMRGGDGTKGESAYYKSLTACPARRGQALSSYERTKLQ
jgi:hypothetical protein